MKLFFKYINAFKNKNQKSTLCKRRGYFLNMADIDGNKLIGLLVITGVGLLPSHEHIKERRKQRQWVRHSIKFCFHFFYTVQVNALYQNVLYSSCLLLFLPHGIQKTKEHILHK